MDTSDETIGAYLSTTLHRQVQATDLGDDLQTLPVQCSHECCQKNTLRQFAQKLVLHFADIISEHKLKPGALITFCFPAGEPVSCFLGATLQRPKLQTLLQAKFDTSSCDYVKIDCHHATGCPKLFTSQHVFLQALSNYRESFTGAREEDLEFNNFSISMEVWAHTVKWVNGHELVPSAEARSFSETLKVHDQRRSRKQPTNLPFGMKMPRKPRQPQQRTGKQSRATRRDSKTGNDNNSGSSEPEGQASSGDDQKVDLSKPVDLSELAASEAVDPVSAVMESEQQNAKKLEQEFKQVEEQKFQIAQQCRGLDQGRMPSSGKTFFSRTLGLDSVGIAASARSICFHCKEHIPKATVRFAWYHSCLRPHGWVHKHCLLQIAKSTGLEAQTVGKLTEIQGAFASSASGSHGPDPKTRDMHEAVTNILSLVQAKPGQ